MRYEKTRSGNTMIRISLNSLHDYKAFLDIARRAQNKFQQDVVLSNYSSHICCYFSETKKVPMYNSCELSIFSSGDKIYGTILKDTNHICLWPDGNVFKNNIKTAYLSDRELAIKRFLNQLYELWKSVYDPD